MPRPKQKRSDGVAALIAHVEAVVAKQPAPFDTRDSVRDRLFALLMQRIDVLQDERDAMLETIAALCRQPAEARHIPKPLLDAMKKTLQRAGAGHTAAHATALAIGYLVIVAVWRNDTSADLSKTMKACDRTLSVLENIAAFV